MRGKIRFSSKNPSKGSSKSCGFQSRNGSTRTPRREVNAPVKVRVPKSLAPFEQGEEQAQRGSRKGETRKGKVVTGENGPEKHKNKRDEEEHAKATQADKERSSPRKFEGFAAAHGGEEEADAEKEQCDARYDPNDRGVYPPKSHGVLDREGEDGWIARESSQLYRRTAKEVGSTLGFDPRRATASRPLEYFHNQEMDLQRPENVIELEWERQGRPDPGPRARSRLYATDGSYTWAPCRVIGYDRGSNAYEIEWEESGKRKRATRLNLIFESESLWGFRMRIQEAELLRAEMEAYERYVHYIRNKEIRSDDIFSGSFFLHLRERSGKKLAARHEEIAEECEEEIRDDYAFASKQCAVESAFEDPKEKANMVAQGVFPRKNVPLGAPPRGCVPLRLETEHSSVAEGGSQPVPLDESDVPDFWDNVEIINNLLPEANESVLAASQRYFGHLEPTSIYLIPWAWKDVVTPPCQLEDFLDGMHNFLSARLSYLTGDWSLSVASVVEELVSDATEQNEFRSPHLLDESESSEYEMPQVSTFKKKLIIVIQDNLRTVAINSVARYENLLWDQMPEENTEDHIPLFAVRLHEDGGKIAFEPSLQSLCEATLRIYDEAIENLEKVEQSDPIVQALGIDGMNTLKSVSMDEDFVTSAKNRSRELLEQGLKGPLELVRSYEDFQWLLDLDEQRYVEDWKASEAELDSWQSELKYLAGLATAVREQSFDTVNYKLVSVDAKPLKELLGNKAVNLREDLLRALENTMMDRNLYVCRRYEEIASTISKEPETPEELDELRKFMQDSRSELASLNEEINISRREMELTGEVQRAFDEKTTSTFYETAHWPVKLEKVETEFMKTLEEHEGKFVSQLAQDKEELNGEIETLLEEVDNLVHLGGMENVDERMSSVAELEAKISRAKELASTYRNRDIIFGQEATDYPQLTTLTKKFEPTATLWRTCAELTHSLPNWHDGPFTSLDPDSISNTLDEWWRNIVGVMKSLPSEPRSVAEEAKKTIENFHQNLPLISALRNPGLRDRHWKQISKAIGFNIQADESFSLSRALQLNLNDYLEQIQAVSDVASKEHSLENALNTMQNEWSGVKFDYKEYRNSGAYVLKAVDEIQMLLDDQIVKVQGMRSSPYVAPLQERVDMWERRLKRMQEILDEMLKCQQSWMYLEPVFGSGDIMQAMPAEGAMFSRVDEYWRDTMSRLAKDPEILIVTHDPEEELLRGLTDANETLDNVQRGLNKYLEGKRTAFPRFFFLSNDELLEILGETQDPLRVQPYLKKIFEGINELEFRDDLEVMGMISEEGERIEFLRTFNPTHWAGSVEKWLCQCEEAMRESVQQTLKDAHTAYLDKPRGEWVLEWPSQMVLNASQIQWTYDVEKAIEGNKVQTYADKCTDQLNELVRVVRGKLSSLQRKVLSALVVIDVHARDVVQHLVDEGVNRVDEFEWIAQLRYYLHGENKDQCYVRMINACLPYGNEYLGAQSRLVITPLTDRCYRTLLGALHLDLGGAPEGPAGTGKTESVKDLAKAIAMHCVVFNCSDGLDYLAMGKFFKGLASSGAWACFDEFNRIDLEVLSVVAQQIYSIVEAKRANVQTFYFEGTHINFRRSANVFITMNPGYAGRSELPDNLKALFRTVAMMVPDYNLIGEILLYSSGYVEARDLARKLVSTYRLCSEQLSSQSHYDYGMRAVISVLRAAANLKQKQPEEEESVLMLRSLRDVNAPKFLAEDIPLFEGILSDLFPGVQLPETDYGDLREAIIANCHKRNLEPTEAFLRKILQLYEMILVRHGLMLVGYSFGAKTSAYRVLQGALTDLKQEEKLIGIAERTRAVVINPKAITLGQLYGQFDPVSHEWQDGVLAKRFRECARDSSPDMKWLVFDGPVDAIWIENMNTVLDDNKKLCLMNGEIIQMSSSMNMIFEVQDLLQASPATVSRCGMVHVESTEIGWRPLLESWINTLPEEIGSSWRERIHGLFEWFVDPCLLFVRKHCKEYVGTLDVGLVRSLMGFFDSLLKPFKDERNEMNEDNQAATSTPSKELTLGAIDACFLFSLIWSIGGVLDKESGGKFNVFLRKMLQKQETGFDLGPRGNIEALPDGVHLPLPEDESTSVYDYKLDLEELQWIPWFDTIDESKPSTALPFNEILVTTVDMERTKYVLDLLTRNRKHVLFIGPTGTGKTAYTKAGLANLEGNKFSTMEVTLSAQTTANLVQDNIESKLDKRRKGVYGPPLGKRAVVFVDDLNMPAPDRYGSQPPIEILRMFMDHQGWYDRNDNTFKRIDDMQFVAAMGPPGGGRNEITPRYLRHFNIVSIGEFGHESLRKIYRTIVDWWIRRLSIPEELGANGPSLVEATIEAYQSVKIELLPTPQKSHYLYNMRDMSKVFQGMSMVGTPPSDLRSMLRLWGHEMLRVFYDRLAEDKDREWYISMLRSVVGNHFNASFDEIFTPREEEGTKQVGQEELRKLIFADFQEPGQPASEREYKEVSDMNKLYKALEEHLETYNNMNKTPMDLVVFLYAAEHICRISRIIRQPMGHALLVGVGGSGRRCLTTISAFMANYKVFTIEVSKNYGDESWKDDLRDVLKRAGAEGEPYVFLLNDSQLVCGSMLEDLNNILNTGEVPNLFGRDDVGYITDKMQPLAKAKGKEETTTELMSIFVEQVKQNLHIVLAFSPIGSLFRDRLRKFPSLVNCCTIDWFSRWPRDALETVAHYSLRDNRLVSEDMRQSVADMCIQFHELAVSLSYRYYQELGRTYHITPTSFLELIRTFKSIMEQKGASVLNSKRRYEEGLSKLYQAESEVGKMKSELEEKKPVLVQKGKETEEMMSRVEQETEEANKKREVVQEDEREASEKAESARQIKEECQQDLERAEPQLQEAKSALNNIRRTDITEMRSLGSPPEPVKLVMKAICILLEKKPNRALNNKTMKREEDWWAPSQALLNQDNFLNMLQNYDKERTPIPEAIIEKIDPILRTEQFQDAKKHIRHSSEVAYRLCNFVKAVLDYDRVVKEVIPKREKLKQAEEEYKKVKEGLESKQNELQEVENKVANLDQKLKEMQREKANLEYDVDLTEKKLERAEKLIGGLGGEKTRWQEVSKKLETSYHNLLGDILLSSGFVAYLGTFTQSYRAEAMQEWAETIKQKEIPCSGNISLQSVLGDPVKIRQWTIDGLPNDSFSVENAIILENSRRWPLMIDPQEQANSWVKNMESANNLIVLKMTDDFRKLENAVSFGTPVLLENVGEELDPTLEPLLNKSIFKSGRSWNIRFGDKTIEYSEDFRLYITTKLRNPVYLPEVSIKVTLLNFMTTPEGLVDQLLSILVAKERPEDEERKAQLVVEGAQNAAKLKEKEDEIIAVLSRSEGNILEDETAINAISEAKQVSNDIDAKQKVADKTEKKIDAIRHGYKPAAMYVSECFFCVSEMPNIDPMYQFVLSWFIELFKYSVVNSEGFQSDSCTQERRMANVKDHFALSLYQNVCRSLFEKDKLLFSFLLSYAIYSRVHKEIGEDAFRFLLTGGVSIIHEKPEKPGTEWITEKSWDEMLRLSTFDHLHGFHEHVASDPDAFTAIYESEQPEKERLPEPMESTVGAFDRLMILRTIRPDRLSSAIYDFVRMKMGDEFVDPPRFDIEKSFEESDPTKPLIFILSPGSDALSSLISFAQSKKVQLHRLSLGQGQGAAAEAKIEAARRDGTWVCLQNCHLAVSWLPKLEAICEGITKENTDPNFRLWLTSYPAERFPVSVLQRAVKMTNEAPSGIRANMIMNYHQEPINSEGFLEGCKQPQAFKKLLFALCFFHAAVQERVKFAPVGFNIPYGFNNTDLRISIDQLRMFLDEQEDHVPFKTLRYTAGECNYGGRVTDDKDRRCLLTMLDDFYCPEVLSDKYSFSDSGRFYAPPDTDWQGYVNYISLFPTAAPPEAMGLHSNAGITKEQQETDALLSGLLQTQSKSGGTGKDAKEQVLEEQARDIKARLPYVFDVERAEHFHPISYHESMNTVLRQELVRFNRLLKVIHSTLHELLRALGGLVIMSHELDAMANSMFNGAVPAKWLSVSYPSMKPLASYVNDLCARCEMLSRWIENGQPVAFWLSGFFFTHAFLTGVLQNYARKHGVPIDTISFDFEFLDTPLSDFTSSPEEGAYVHGIFLEGATWDASQRCLAEPRPKVLASEAPVLWLKPAPSGSHQSYDHYLCPLYRTAERRGVLTTTGHSSNFVIDIKVPTDVNPRHWIKRGVAALLSLSD